MISYQIARELIDSNLKSVVTDFKNAFQELEQNQAVIIKATEKIVYFNKEDEKLFITMLNDNDMRDIKVESTYEQLQSFFVNNSESKYKPIVVEAFSEKVAPPPYEDQIHPILNRELSATPITEEALERIAVNLKLQIEQGGIDKRWIRHMKVFYDSFTQESQITIGKLELEYDLDGNNISIGVWEGSMIEPWEK